LKDKIKQPEYIKEIKVSGPYLNFKINPKNILESIIELKSDYGRFRDKDIIANGQYKSRVVIEYPSPNTNKSLHFGHVRNMVFIL